MKKEKTNIVELADRKYQRSTFLISAKYRSSLLENKILAISLTKVFEGEYHEDGGGNIVVQIRAAELRRLLKTNAGSFYSQLEPIANAMVGRSLGWRDPEHQRFKYISVISNAEYGDGVFTMEFNHHLRQYILNLPSHYTMFNLRMMLDFKSDPAFRLYELLKSRSYAPRGTVDTGVYNIEFGLAELKLELGIVNAASQKVRSVLDGEKNPDYEKAVEMATEKSYNRWCDFNNRILKKAQEQINEISDMRISYQALGSGKGGKVYKVVFRVELVGFQGKSLSEDEKDRMIDDLADELSLRRRDARAICDAASYDEIAIRRALDVMEDYGSEIRDVVGFLIRAIQKGYETGEKISFRPEQPISSADTLILRQA